MDPTRQALEANLADHPNDLVAHAAYADWLTENDDSRGEYIREALALQDLALAKKERNRRARALVDYAKQHEEEWLGPLHQYVQTDWWPLECRLATVRGSRISMSLQWGWIRSIQMPYQHRQMWTAFLNCPINRVVQQITRSKSREEADDDPTENEDPTACEDPSAWVMDLAQFTGLRHLYVDFYEFSDVGIEKLVASGILAHLQTFEVSGFRVTEVGALALASDPHIRNLKRLKLCWHSITPVGQAALAAVGFGPGKQRPGI